jgi:hypothetical protein
VFSAVGIEGLRQRITRNRAKLAEERAARDRDWREGELRKREEWDREMAELMDAARAREAMMTPEERLARNQEWQRQAAARRDKERSLLHYTAWVVAAATVVLIGVALVVIFGFVTTGPKGVAVAGLVLAWLGWIPFASPAATWKRGYLD